MNRQIVRLRIAVVCVSAATLLFLTAQWVQAAPVQWTVGAGGNGHYYDIVESGHITWDDARVAAATLPSPTGFGPGHLLTISDAAENSFVASTIAPLIFFSGSGGGISDGAWFGFTDQAVEGEWRWIDSTPGLWQDPYNFATPIQTAYVNWETGPPEPNGHDQVMDGDEDWGSMRNNARWNDYSQYRANLELNTQYLVEFEPVPEPSTVLLAVIGVATIVVGQRLRLGKIEGLVIHLE